MQQGHEPRIRGRLSRANEALLGAASEFAAGRYNNTTSRAYYACFHIAVASLLLDGASDPPGNQWRHAQTIGRFAGLLRRWDIESPVVGFRSLRERADYAADTEGDGVSSLAAARILGEVLTLRYRLATRLNWR